MADINIHIQDDLRISLFQPLNRMALQLSSGEDTICLFGLAPEIAWTMFDLLRDGGTHVHLGDESLKLGTAEPQAAADLIRRARAQTLEAAQ